MNTSKYLLLALASGLCGPAAAGTDPQFGITVNNNIAIQTIDMNAHHAGTPPLGGNGERSVAAYRRYLSGNVKALLQASGASQVGAQGGALEKQTLQPAGK